MTIVNIDVQRPAGQPRGHQAVLVSLIHGGAGGSDGVRVIGDTDTIRLDADGHAEVDLAPNDDITPAGTFYRITVPGAQPSVTRHIEVPSSASPISWADPAIQVLSPTPPDFVAVVEGVVAEAGPGIVSQALAELDELADGYATVVDDSTTGLVKVHHAPLVFASKTAATSGTSSQTSLLSSTLTVPGSWTRGGNLFSIDLFGSLNNNTGGAANFTLSVRVGATAAWTWTLTGLSASATDRPWQAQIVGSVAEVVPDTFAILIGPGAILVGPAGGGAVAASQIVSPGTPLFTPGASISLDVRVQHSTSSASQSSLLAAGSRLTLGVPG